MLLVMQLTRTRFWYSLRRNHFGAKSVVVAEGPGHQRDTQLVLSQSEYQRALRDEQIQFVDLNRDELIRTPLRAGYTGMKRLWLPRTVPEADFLCLHAQNQDTSLVWCNPQHEEHVRHRTRIKIRMAEEYPSLEGHPGKHPRHMRHGSNQFRNCGRNRCDGR